MLYTEAFARYKAKLKNVNWSVSAESTNGELIISLWKHRFAKPEGNTIKYVDFVTRWKGPGSNELRARLQEAHINEQVIRPVIARTSDVKAVEEGVDASTLKNQFFVREDWFGKLTSWDGDNFEITFVRRSN